MLVQSCLKQDAAILKLRLANKSKSEITNFNEVYLAKQFQVPNSIQSNWNFARASKNRTMAKQTVSRKLGCRSFLCSTSSLSCVSCDINSFGVPKRTGGVQLSIHLDVDEEMHPKNPKMDALFYMYSIYLTICLIAKNIFRCQNVSERLPTFKPTSCKC